MTKLLTLTLASGAILAAGCGSSDKPPVTAKSSQQNNGVQAAYKYADCMRAHGVSNFQDPKVSTRDGGVSVAIHVTPAITGSPAFKSAQATCGKLLPDGGNGPTPTEQHAHVAGLVSFARCMRSHGLTSFPDPTTQGNIDPQMLAAAGVNIHSPGFIKDAYACVPSSEGQLTRAQIAEAEAGG